MTPTEDDVRRMLSDVAHEVDVPDLAAASAKGESRRRMPWAAVVAACAAVLLAVLVPTVLLDRGRQSPDSGEPAGHSSSTTPESPTPTATATQPPQSELAEARALVGESTPLRRSYDQRPVITEDEALALGSGEKAYGPFQVGYRREPAGRAAFVTWRTCWIVADKQRWTDAIGAPLDHEGELPKQLVTPWTAFDATTGAFYRGGLTPVEE